MKRNAQRAIMAGVATASMLGGVVIGATAFGGTSALAASTTGTVTSSAASTLTQTDAVIDFNHTAIDSRVTVKLAYDQATFSTNPADFLVEVIITDTRTGVTTTSGRNPPTTVR